MNANNAIRVCLYDDQEWVHEIVGEVLQRQPDIVLVNHAAQGVDVAEGYSRYRPDVVLMDVVMPGMDGIQAMRALLAAHPAARVLALSSFKDEAQIYAMLRGGAMGYVLKENLYEELVPSIRAVHSGSHVLSPKVTAILTGADDAPQFNLTPREIELLALLALGLTNKEAAARLSITESTVRFHITNIVEKMGVETRTEALVVAVRQGIV